MLTFKRPLKLTGLQTRQKLLYKRREIPKRQFLQRIRSSVLFRAKKTNKLLITLEETQHQVWNLYSNDTYNDSILLMQSICCCICLLFFVLIIINSRAVQLVFGTIFTVSGTFRVPLLWEAEVEKCLKPGVQDQPGKQSETLFVQKNFLNQLGMAMCNCNPSYSTG